MLEEMFQGFMGINSAQLRKLAELREELETVEAELSRRFGERTQENQEETLSPKPARTKKRYVSPETRALISVAMKKRWRATAKRNGSTRQTKRNGSVDLVNA